MLAFNGYLKFSDDSIVHTFVDNFRLMLEDAKYLQMSEFRAQESFCAQTDDTGCCS